MTKVYCYARKSNDKAKTHFRKTALRMEFKFEELLKPKKSEEDE